MKKQPFMNFVVDHMTLLVDPKWYNVAYCLFRIVLGVAPDDLIYEKRRKWPGESKERPMTFAMRVGRGEAKRELNQSIIAVVVPSEPSSAPSHVREIIKNSGGTAHWQHIALRTPNLLAFHKHALERGVNFITPILKDAAEDVIQVFSGEWNIPGARPTGVFFEFVQRDPNEALLKKLAQANREAWFRDKTFLGLYDEKENEYRSGKITPFIDDALFEKIYALVGKKAVWEIGDKDLEAVESAMLDYAKGRAPAQNVL